MSPAPRPRYLVLADDLVARIMSGEFARGDRLPTEAELCAQYEVARGTVRGALDQLETLEMISRRPSAGTRVIATQPQSAYQPVARSPQDIVDLVAKTKIEDPQSRDIVAGAALAKRLGVTRGTKLFLLEGRRVRRKSAELPLCWSQLYVHGSVDADARELLRRGAFTAADTGARIEQAISAEILSPEFAEALCAEAGSAALVISRWAYDQDGALLSIGVHTHPADRFRITSTLMLEQA
jgi:GntR family transcriptional regulator